jgi:hypothetical protein
MGDKKFVVVAVSDAGTAAVWTAQGWMFLKRAMLPVTAVALSSAEACKVRDDAQRHSLPKDYGFHIVRLS